MDGIGPTTQISTGEADAQAAGIDRDIDEDALRAQGVADIIEHGPPGKVACYNCRGMGSIKYRGVGITCPLIDKPECSANVRRASDWDESGIGSRYRTAEWEKVSPAIAAPLRAYADSFKGRYDSGPTTMGTNLILLGGVGTGKTCALALVAKAVIYSDLEVVWRYVPALFDQLHKGEPEADKARFADVLVLDDFGVQYAADWSLSRFDALVEWRYSHYKPVVVSTNRDWDELTADPLYTRIVSRWRENAVVIATGGDDRRGRR